MERQNLIWSIRGEFGRLCSGLRQVVGRGVDEVRARGRKVRDYVTEVVTT
jgi:hypothetical protein